MIYLLSHMAPGLPIPGVFTGYNLTWPAADLFPRWGRFLEQECTGPALDGPGRRAVRGGEPISHL